MESFAQFVAAVSDRPSDRRVEPRTEVEIPVKILVIRKEEDLTDPVYLDGIIHNLSSEGAMLSVSESLAKRRVWLRFDQFDNLYLQAELVRNTNSPIPVAHCYGVQFTRMLSEVQFEKLVDRHSSHVLRRTPSVLQVTQGDVIELDHPAEAVAH